MSFKFRVGFLGEYLILGFQELKPRGFEEGSGNGKELWIKGNSMGIQGISHIKPLFSPIKNSEFPH